MANLYKRIISSLRESQIEYQETRHAPVFTSEEAARERGTKISEGAKALLFWAQKEKEVKNKQGAPHENTKNKPASKFPIQIVIQGDKRVDKERFKKLFGFSKLKMVSADEVKQIADVEPGAVPPFGNLFKPPIPIYVEEGILKNREIEFNAGDHKISIRMRAEDWKKLLRPVVEGFKE